MSHPISPVEKPKDVPADLGDIAALSVEVDELVKASQARAKFGVNGSGFTAAVLDTGLRTTHEDFRGRVLDQVNYTSDNGADAKNASDGHGHGTNVAGIILATREDQDPPPHRGIAPGARVIPIKVLNNSGGGDFADVERGLQWVLENRGKHNISVACLSLGDGKNYTDHSQHNQAAIGELIENLRAARVATVIASGNDYFRHSSKEGMSFPAIVSKCISVGAVYDAKEGPFSYASGARAYESDADRITPFSQRLHESTNPEAFTTLFAPGAPVTSSGWQTDTASSTQSGTSQSAPVVCGVVLLAQELHMRIVGSLPSVDSLIEWMRLGAVKINDGDDESDNVEHTHKDFLRLDAEKTLGAVARSVNRRLAFSSITSAAELA